MEEDKGSLKLGSLKTVPIGDVIPYDRNPRKISKKAISVVQKSIEEFGYNVPIVVDAKMVVVTGHTRLLACKQMGLREVTVLVAPHLSERDASEFRLVDNRTGDMASWDDDLLLAELRGLSTQGEMDDFFKDGELDKLMGSLDEAGKVTETPTQAEIENKKEQLGEVFEKRDEEYQERMVPCVCKHCGESFNIDRRLATPKKS